MNPTKNVSVTNPWFGVSMALFGVIVGYSLSQMTAGPIVGGTQVAPAPTAAAPTPTPSAPAPAPSADNVKKVDPKVDNIRGDLKAAITVIEYSDFECPFCQRHHPTLQKVVDDYDGKVNWVYRHFPLSFHPNAQKAAEASQCVREFGGNDKFWDFADVIFEKGAINSAYADYAEEIGLDKQKVQDCIDSGKYEQYVKTDMQEGSDAGVTGTPGNIVLNNKTGEAKIVSGAQPYSAFKAIIDEML